MSALTLSASSAHEGTTVTGTVKLAKPAPVDGIVVDLGVGDVGEGPLAPDVSTPRFVKVPNGSTTATFPINVTTAPNAEIVPITASLGSTRSQPDLVVVHSNKLTLSYEGTYVGVDTRMAVGIGTTWNGLGATISLKSDNPAVTVPNTVQIPGWTPGLIFPVKVSGVIPRNTTVHITATWLGTTVTSFPQRPLTPPPQPPSVSPSRRMGVIRYETPSASANGVSCRFGSI